MLSGFNHAGCSKTFRMIALHPRRLLLFLMVPWGLSGCAVGMNASEKMMWSTYEVITEKGAATGFVVKRRPSRRAGSRAPVMLTSSHVLDTLGEAPLLLVLRSRDAQGTVEPVLLVLVQPSSTAKMFHVRHPRHDIAAFPLHLPSELAEFADLDSFLTEDGLGQTKRILRSGMEVAFLGYPDVLPGTAGAFPVLRSGRVASYPIGAAQADGAYLINADVYPGDSGAPVILAGRDGPPRLVGMVIRRVGPEAQSFSHLAIAVDSDVIRETLQLLAESEDRLENANLERPDLR